MSEIIRTYNELEKLVQKTYTDPDIGTLRRAYEVAEAAHSGETRLTGHPVISHPLAVSYRLAEMGLHTNVLIAGLLHDIVEDSEVTVEDLKEQFGEDVASLVESVTKLKHGIKYRGSDRYAENMRKMFLAMASDVRVVFMKFADRIHNLSTLYGQPKHKQVRIARESLEIYAPIAGRLGMSEFKGELEDSSFAYLYPKEYERMKNIMDIKVREKGAYVSGTIEKVEKLLLETSITEVQVHGRVKRLYSLHKKLNRYQGDLSKIYDLIAVRIIVSDVEDCYLSLGLLHRRWRPVPGRIKDYIAQPKPNGYQSLHTTVFTENGEIVEFQIRTLEMHELAEYGVAAHWRYKEGSHKLARNTHWMEELVHIQKELESKKDFMEQLEVMKIDVFKDRIFIFTPQGDVIDLPEGATPVDFAYAIHTEVGNKCTAARVNEMMRNLDTPLKSGDIVEIVTDKNRKGPNPDWMKSAKTRHARSKIKEATKNTVKGWFAEVLKGREKAKR
jgi:GTP diphosphokinase / guanosine-3',5'-bis(diphosphate) 3'-diphosphatase